jgi:hypothetical protein
MKPRSHRPIEKLLAFAAAFLSLAFACLATQARTNAPAKASPTATNTAPVQVEIPKSVFAIPTTPQEGKDPFFPRSMRLFSSIVVKTNLPPTPPSVELRLNGISGTADRRLVIINNRTFETNEEGEVSTKTGHARIRCLEIKPDSVVVQVGDEQRVLHFRPGF